MGSNHQTILWRGRNLARRLRTGGVSLALAVPGGFPFACELENRSLRWVGSLSVGRRFRLGKRLVYSRQRILLSGLSASVEKPPDE